MRKLSEEELEEFPPMNRKYIRKDKNGDICIPGLFGCPWCDSDGHETNLASPGISMACNKNQDHKYHWLFWGG